jgi:hypothetical protein
MKKAFFSLAILFVAGGAFTQEATYTDKFTNSEVVRRYQKTTTSSSYTREGQQFNTLSYGSNGEVYGHPGSPGYLIKTMYYNVYEVTVTRNWYTRTWHYKDNRTPTTQRVYKDTESSVLVNKYSRRERVE